MVSKWQTVTIIVALLRALSASARADTPPPLHFQGGGAVLGKGKPVRLATFSDLTPKYLQDSQGNVYDTTQYCSAIIDVASSGGVPVIIRVVGESDYSTMYSGVDEVKPIHFPGPADGANDQGVRKASFVVPLRHAMTDFGVWRDFLKTSEIPGMLYVYLAPIECGISLPPY